MCASILRWLASLGLALCLGAGAQAELRIGRIGSLNNPIAAPSTIAVSQGFDMYVKKVNAEGGVHGQPIRVIFKDDGFNPDATLASAKELIEKDNVLLIINPQGTPGPAKILSDGLLKRTNTAILAPFTGATSVLSGENIFPLRSSYDDEVMALAQQMRVIGQQRVAYLFYNTSFGPTFAPTFEKIVKSHDLNYVGKSGYEIVADPAKQAAEVQAAVERLREMKPDAVFVFAVGPTFPLAAKALNRILGKGVVRYTFSINNWENLIKQAGLDDAHGMVFSQSVPFPFSTTRRITREYVRDSQRLAPDVQVSFAGLEGYMTARLLVEVLLRAGRDPSREKVLKALLDTGRRDLGDYLVAYSPERRRVESAIDITIIGANGKLIK